MAGKWFYLTIMKGRKAEYGALLDIDQETFDRLASLIMLWPGESKNDDPTTPMWPDAGGDKAARGLVTDLLGRMKGRWPSDRPIILDGDWIGPDALAQVLEAVRNSGWQPLPVTGLNRDELYQEIVATAMGQDGQGCVLRLQRADLNEDLPEQIEAWLRRFGLAPAQVDLIIDLGPMDRPMLARDEIIVINVLRVLPQLHEWRNLAVAGSSVPKVVGKDVFPLDDSTPYPRLEWWLWQNIQERALVVGRVPTFGDYGAIHPERVEESRVPQSLPRIPSVRYAGENDELLLRGEDLDNDATDPDGFRRLLEEKLIGDKDRWPGNNYSWAERWIVSVARSGASLGNHRIWHKVWTVRHWTFVSRQLAK